MMPSILSSASAAVVQLTLPALRKSVRQGRGTCSCSSNGTPVYKHFESHSNRAQQCDSHRRPRLAPGTESQNIRQDTEVDLPVPIKIWLRHTCLRILLELAFVWWVPHAQQALHPIGRRRHGSSVHEA